MYSEGVNCFKTSPQRGNRRGLNHPEGAEIDTRGGAGREGGGKHAVWLEAERRAVREAGGRLFIPFWKLPFRTDIHYVEPCEALLLFQSTRGPWQQHRTLPSFLLPFARNCPATWAIGWGGHLSPSLRARAHSFNNSRRALRKLFLFLWF